MLIRDNAIDGGKGFDWGKVSTDYAKKVESPQQKNQIPSSSSGEKLKNSGVSTNVDIPLCL